MADSVAKMKSVFFDRRAVIDAVGRANAAVLAKAGAYKLKASAARLSTVASTSCRDRPCTIAYWL